MTNQIIIKNLGELKKHESYIEGLFVSNEVEVPFFNNKKFRFVVDVGHDYDGTKIDFQKVEIAVENFLALDALYRESISSVVYKNYKAVIDNCGMDEITMSDVKDIWNHVSPIEILIKNEGYFESGIYSGIDIFVTVDCKCDWDEEHGLQLSFRMGNKDVDLH